MVYSGRFRAGPSRALGSALSGGRWAWVRMFGPARLLLSCFRVPAQAGNSPRDPIRAGGRAGGQRSGSVLGNPKESMGYGCDGGGPPFTLSPENAGSEPQVRCHLVLRSFGKDRGWRRWSEAKRTRPIETRDRLPQGLFFVTVSAPFLRRIPGWPKQSSRPRSRVSPSVPAARSATSTVGDQLLLVTTDRVSAFDVVLPEGIPEKGRVLNSLSAWWLRRTEHIVPNHLVTDDVDEYPGVLAPAKGMLDGRSMLVRRLNPIPFECVMRGFLYGSGWKEYGGKAACAAFPSERDAARRAFSRAPLHAGDQGRGRTRRERQRGLHGERAGPGADHRLHEVSREIYASGVEWAAERGIIIADTKFEFGHDDDGKLYVIDEVLTPDSSRFWPAEEYAPGKLQSSFDKQYVRDYLETVDWNKEPPAPHLPDSIVRGTTERFLSAYRQITGSSLPAPRY